MAAKSTPNAVVIPGIDGRYKLMPKGLTALTATSISKKLRVGEGRSLDEPVASTPAGAAGRGVSAAWADELGEETAELDRAVCNLSSMYTFIPRNDLL